MMIDPSDAIGNDGSEEGSPHSTIRKIASCFSCGVYRPGKENGVAYAQIKIGSSRYRFGFWLKSPISRGISFCRFDNYGLEGAWHFNIWRFSAGKIIDR